jgi:hypothetical protein
MGGAAYFGLALISGSKLVLSLAVIRHLANWWFLSTVEQWVFPPDFSDSHLLTFCRPFPLAHTCANFTETHSERMQGS